MINNNAARNGIGIVSGSSPVISNNTIGGLIENAIYINGGSNPMVSGNTITGSGTGISTSGSSGTYEDNTIAGNANYGMYNSSGNFIDAINNYWGDPSGPLDESDDRASGGLYNPDGQGDRVSDRVNYYPWADASIITTTTTVSSSTTTSEVQTTTTTTVMVDTTTSTVSSTTTTTEVSNTTTSLPLDTTTTTVSTSSTTSTASSSTTTTAVQTTTTTVPQSGYVPPDDRPYIQFIDQNGYTMQSDQGGFYEFVDGNMVPPTLNYEGIIKLSTNSYTYKGWTFSCYDLKLEVKYLSTSNASDIFRFENVSDGQTVQFSVNTSKMNKTLTGMVQVAVTFHECTNHGKFAEPPQGLGINNNSPANDSDADGIPDSIDNCPNNCNANQLDADGDGIGDVCDTTPGCGGCSGVECEQEC